jgi:hypothetical protein
LVGLRVNSNVEFRRVFISIVEFRGVLCGEEASLVAFAINTCILSYSESLGSVDSNIGVCSLDFGLLSLGIRSDFSCLADSKVLVFDIVRFRLGGCGVNSDSGVILVFRLCPVSMTVGRI